MMRKILGFICAAMLVSVEDFFEGGHSICRNSSLHKMFEMIGGGERAGSGADTSACSVHQFT